MTALSFLTPDHHRSTYAVLAAFQTETASIQHVYEDVEVGHVIRVRRSYRWNRDSNAPLITEHPVSAEMASYWFLLMVGAAMRSAPSFIPAET
jgi:hypothetical protein